MMKYTTDLFQLKVLVDDKPIQEYHKDGKTFVEGRQGSNFSLKLKNLTGRRILVHPTVDGLSAMTGKEASRRDSSHGYVLSAFEEATIPGWRLDDKEVAQFFFAGDGKSYAEKTGKGLDKGVVACAVWEEKPYDPPAFIYNLSSGRCGGQSIGGGGDWEPSSLHAESYSKGGQQTNCSTRPKGITRSVATSNLGAGFGEKTDHKVSTTSFTPETKEPVLIAAIYYDDKSGLRARGIRLSKKQRQPRTEPNPFPKDTACAPPAGWRR
jgi:hypothetical protein